MAVKRQNWITAALNILEELHYEDPSVVCAHYKSRKVRSDVKCLIRDPLVRVKEIMLMATEIMLLYEGMDADQRTLRRLRFVRARIDGAWFFGSGQSE